MNESNNVSLIEEDFERAVREIQATGVTDADEIVKIMERDYNSLLRERLGLPPSTPAKQKFDKVFREIKSSGVTEAKAKEIMAANHMPLIREMAAQMDGKKDISFFSRPPIAMMIAGASSLFVFAILVIVGVLVRVDSIDSPILAPMLGSLLLVATAVTFVYVYNRLVNWDLRK
jgi:hypothetical protein